MRIPSPFYALLSAALLLASTACASPDQPARATDLPADTTSTISHVRDSTNQQDVSSHADYNFAQPDAAFKLPGALVEISGLTVLDEMHLGAIQDEDGKLYAIEISTGRVPGDHNFYEDGDYEGLEKVGDVVWILESDGTLYELKDWREPKSDAKKHKTSLGRSCDAEGLGYDRANNRLLIACKEKPGKGLKGMRAIYGFDLEENALIEKPVYLINATQFEASGTLQKGLRDLVEPVMDLDGFKPAALAIHPRTGHLYVISSAQKILIALDSDGTLVYAWSLSPSLFGQPEGMAFLPNGDLFISNEGRGGSATLLRFNEKSGL